MNAFFENNSNNSSHCIVCRLICSGFLLGGASFDVRRIALVKREKKDDCLLIPVFGSHESQLDSPVRNLFLFDRLVSSLLWGPDLSNHETMERRNKKKFRYIYLIIVIFFVIIIKVRFE